jgi:hypothetical protein
VLNQVYWLIANVKDKSGNTQIMLSHCSVSKNILAFNDPPGSKRAGIYCPIAIFFVLFHLRNESY